MDTACKWTLCFHQGAGYVASTESTIWCKDLLKWGEFQIEGGEKQIVHRVQGTKLCAGWKNEHKDVYLPLTTKITGKPLVSKLHIFQGKTDGCMIWWELWQIQQYLFEMKNRPNSMRLHRHWHGWAKKCADLGIPSSHFLKAKVVKGRFAAGEGSLSCNSQMLPEATASTTALTLWLCSMPFPRPRGATE